MSNTNKNFDTLRIVGVTLIICIVFCMYTMRLYSLQYVHGQQYLDKSKEVSSRSSIIPSKRGEIFDRNKDYPLVTNIDSFVLQLTPAEVKDDEWNGLFSNLADLLGISEQKLNERVPDNSRHYFKPIDINTGTSYSTITQIAERINEFPGVSWINRPNRNYLDVRSLSHILGYVGKINSEELQVLYNQGYEVDDVIGKSGVEKIYDQILRGKSGYRLRTVDVRGRDIANSESETVPPLLGNSVSLTIDRDIQDLAEKALGDRMGAAVVLKPASGEVLAMVSYPYYDPNLFNRENSSEIFNKLSLDSRYPFLNRAIQSSYAPASTFKIVMTAALLQEQAFDPLKKVVCTGTYVVGNRTFHCWFRTGHGPVNMAEALAESCNVYFYTMGNEYLGYENIINYSGYFGLGQTTGIDLPGEITGNVPTPAWKEDIYHTPWVGGDTVNMSIGQGFTTVTPIQMANVMALILNKGTIYKPHVLKEVLDPVTGEVLQELEPEVLHEAPITKENLETLQDYLRGVVVNGTPNVVITNRAVKSGGKTGTGQVGIKDRETSWYVAFAPYGVPVEEQLVVVTMVEATNEWEWWAPKAADIILQGIFADQDYDEAVKALNAWYM
nr:penicillin-binding protein 2 [Spirochaeta cellobiosiphila]